MRAFSSLLAFSCSTKAGRVRQYTAANSAQEFDSLMSTVRHRFDASPGRLDAEEARGLAGLDAAPELLLGGEQKVLIERVGVDLDLDPLAPACMMERTELLERTTHMLCWSCAMCFSAAPSSEKAQGSMNLASNTASVLSTTPSRVAAIQNRTGCRTQRCMSLSASPVFASNQRRFRASVATPSRTTRLLDRSAGSTSPRFSCLRRRRAASSLPMIIRASEPPMKSRRLGTDGEVWVGKMSICMLLPCSD